MDRGNTRRRGKIYVADQLYYLQKEEEGGEWREEGGRLPYVKRRRDGRTIGGRRKSEWL